MGDELQKVSENTTAINFDAKTTEERKLYKLWCMENNVSMREDLANYVHEKTKNYKPDPKVLLKVL